MGWGLLVSHVEAAGGGSEKKRKDCAGSENTPRTDTRIEVVGQSHGEYGTGREGV